MKAMIMDMCILSHKTQCFLMFGHVVGVGAGKLRGLPVLLLYIYNYITNDYLSAFPVVRWRQRQPGIVVGLQRGRFPSETLGLQTFSQAERDDPPRMDNKTPPKDADFQDISVRILGNWRFGHIWTIFLGVLSGWLSKKINHFSWPQTICFEIWGFVGWFRRSNVSGCVMA